MRKGNIPLNKTVIMIVGVIVLIIVIYVGYIGLTRGGLIIDQITAGNIKDPNGVGSEQQCPAEYKVAMKNIGDIFYAQSLNDKTRCLVKAPKAANWEKQMLTLEATSIGTTIGLSKYPQSPQVGVCSYKKLDEKGYSLMETTEIKGIYPCLVGTADRSKYNAFKDNWFNDKTPINQNEFLIINLQLFEKAKIRLSKTVLIQGVEFPDAVKQEDDFDYYYRVNFQGKKYLCLFQDERDEDDLTPNVLPLCDAGADQQCTMTKDGKIYKFNPGEYYCSGKSPDEIKECQPNHNWKTVIGVDTCLSEGIPFSQGENCCCTDKQCVRHMSGPIIQREAKCEAFGEEWKQKSCPFDQVRIIPPAETPPESPPTQITPPKIVDCSQELDDYTYTFKAGEYFCKTNNGKDQVQECKTDGSWSAVKIFSQADQCAIKTGTPPSDKDQCCCKKDGDKKHCVKMTNSCSAFADFDNEGKVTGNEWEQKTCPIDQSQIGR